MRLTIEQLSIPGLRVPGCEYFVPPLRWDQKLFAFNIKGQQVPQNKDIDLMCKTMGGNASSYQAIKRFGTLR